MTQPTTSCPLRIDEHGSTCDRPSALLEYWVGPSADGPVEHRRLRCEAGHALIHAGPPVSLDELPPLHVTTIVFRPGDVELPGI